MVGIGFYSLFFSASVFFSGQPYTFTSASPTNLVNSRPSSGNKWSKSEPGAYLGLPFHQVRSLVLRDLFMPVRPQGFSMDMSSSPAFMSEVSSKAAFRTMVFRSHNRDELGSRAIDQKSTFNTRKIMGWGGFLKFK